MSEMKTVAASSIGRWGSEPRQSSTARMVLWWLRGHFVVKNKIDSEVYMESRGRDIKKSEGLGSWTKMLKSFAEDSKS